jgi:hypothetical protein
MTKMTKTRATQLTKQIRENFLNAEKALKEFIPAQGWASLGYATCALWWESEMKGVRLASDGMKVAVVLALYDGGVQDPERIAEVLGFGSGVSTRTVKNVIDQRESNPDLPIEFMSTRRRPRRIGVAHDADVHESFALRKEDAQLVDDLARELGATKSSLYRAWIQPHVDQERARRELKKTKRRPA